MITDIKHKTSKKFVALFFLLMLGTIITILVIASQRDKSVSIRREQIPSDAWDAALSIDNLNLISPVDILDEVSYYGAGSELPKMCNSSPPSIILYSTKKTQSEWLAPITFYDCGWKDGEQIKVTILAPNGEKYTDSFIAKSGPKYEFQMYDYRMMTNAPLGEYIFEFSGESGNVEKLVEVYLPNFPHVYGNYAEKQLVLYGFEPKEKVQIFVFFNYNDSKYIFIGWFSAVLDEYGQVIY
jgi:hypothetical protein